MMQAKNREHQLEMNGKTVYSLDRFAIPEEAHQHLDNPGQPDIGVPSRADGRYTHVWDVWIATGKMYRKHKILKTQI